MKSRWLWVLFAGLLLACSAGLTTVPTNQNPEVTLPPYAPDTPGPAAIAAPPSPSPALVSFHFTGELDGWGITPEQIVRTNDGGLTWYNVTPPELTEAGYTARLVALSPSQAWIQIPDLDNYPKHGFLYRTSDGGLSWSRTETPFSGGDLEFLDARNGWMLADLGVGAGSQGVAVFQTRDGGASWTQTFTNDPNLPDSGDAIPLGGLKSGIAPLNMTTAWVYGVVYSPATVYLFRTEDGGQNWSNVNSVEVPYGAAEAELSIDGLKFLSPTEGWLAMRVTGADSRMAIYTTTDAGQRWTQTPTLVPGGGSVDFMSTTAAVIYNGGQFHITQDAGGSWNTVSPDVAFGDTFAGMDFVNATTGWVLTLDPSTNQSTLYRSVDGGSTWVPVSPCGC